MKSTCQNSKTFLSFPLHLRYEDFYLTFAYKASANPKFTQTGDRIENAVGVKDCLGLKPHKRSSNTYGSVSCLSEMEKKMKLVSEATNVLAVKILERGGRVGGAVNPSPHLGVFSKTNPSAHIPLVPFVETQETSSHWIESQSGFLFAHFHQNSTQSVVPTFPEFPD